MSVTTDENGVLTCMVQQKEQNPLQYSEQQVNWIETFKGPTSAVDHVNLSGVTLYGKNFRIGDFRPTGLKTSGSFVIDHDAPNINGYKWRIVNITSEDCDSGLHEKVRIQYKLSTPSGENISPNAGENMPKEIWKVSYAGKNPSVLAYACISAEGTPSPVRTTIPSEMVADEFFSQGKSMNIVPAIKCWAEQQGDKSNKYLTQPNDFAKGFFIYELYQGDVISAMADYYLAGVNPNLHYPVLTKTSYKYSALDIDLNSPELSARLSAFNQIGQWIDYIDESVQSQCPIKFKTQYKWLKVGDDLEVRTDGYTRTETWWGDTEWNQHFYGPDGTRWVLGKMDKDGVRG